VPERRPLICVVASRRVNGQSTGSSGSFHAVGDAYLDAIWRAGGRPLLLTTHGPDDVARVLDLVDAVVLTGGSDVDPARYGAVAHRATTGIDAMRDATELAVVEAVVAAGLPLLGICRGHQVINVAFGGTLVQHLGDHPSSVDHADPATSASVPHEITLDAAASVARWCGAERVVGASHHHQAVDRLGAGLTAVGWTKDGCVEAFERSEPAPAPLVGLQWHPEVTAAADPVQQRVFDGFVETARRRSAAVTH
jgi:putative glutamine amidotransferase